MPAITPGRVALLSFLPVANQTWTGTDGAVAVAATSGSFAPGTVTWVGTDGTVTILAAEGAWVAAQTWASTEATVTVTATSGSFIALIASGYVCLDVVADSVTLTVSEDC